MKPHNFFHDRAVLLLLAVNSFLSFTAIITILLRLRGSGGNFTYEYRSNLSRLSQLKVGGVEEIVSFIAFVVLIFALQLIISKRVYHIRKQAAYTVLALSSVLLLFSLVISYYLLKLN